MRFTGAKRAPGVWQRIISLFPPHARFVEAFGGTGHITHMKARVQSLVIDADPAAPCLTMAAAPLVQRICGDARTILPTLDLGPADLVYADPPYPNSVRRHPRRYYRCELQSDEEHAALLALLTGLPCMVAVSGYRCALYDHALAGWQREDIPTVTRGGGAALESVWFNWTRGPVADPRFVGRDFRERERIKRKARRWVAMLEAMPAHERAAILAALGDGIRA